MDASDGAGQVSRARASSRGKDIIMCCRRTAIFPQFARQLAKNSGPRPAPPV